MLEKDLRVLRLRSVAGIRIDHELGIRQVLGQEEGVNRDDDDVFAPMHNQGSLVDPRQHSVAVSQRNGSPIRGSPPTESLPPSWKPARRDPRREASIVRYRLAPQPCWPHSE